MEVVTKPRYWGEPGNISVRMSNLPAKTRTQHFPIKKVMSVTATVTCSVTLPLF